MSIALKKIHETLHLMQKTLGSSEKYFGVFSTEKIATMIQTFQSECFSAHPCENRTILVSNLSKIF